MKIISGVIEELDIAGRPEGPLWGKTFVAKDLFDIANYPTSAGNPDWKRTHPTPSANAKAVQLLLDAGARLVGKALTDELALSLTGINTHYGVPHNPNQPGHIPGGSSSGSAAAVAQGLADFALGTDTAGSVRVPSAFCGIFGMRPTHGRVSSAGVVPLGPSFDTVGWMARSAHTLMTVGSVLLGTDRKPNVNSKTRKLVVPDACTRLLSTGLEFPFMAACNKLSRELHATEMLEHPQVFITMDLPHSLSALSSVFSAARGFEAWAAHGQWLEEVNPSMAPNIKSRFLACKEITKEQWQDAMELRQKMIVDYQEFLADKILCLPTIAEWAPLVSASDDELNRVRQLNVLLNTIASTCGLPQLTIPVRFGEGPCFGISLLSATDEDFLLLRMATLAEKCFN